MKDNLRKLLKKVNLKGYIILVSTSFSLLLFMTIAMIVFGNKMPELERYYSLIFSTALLGTFLLFYWSTKNWPIGSKNIIPASMVIDLAKIINADPCLVTKINSNCKKNGKIQSKSIYFSFDGQDLVIDQIKPERVADLEEGTIFSMVAKPFSGGNGKFFAEFRKYS